MASIGLNPVEALKDRKNIEYFYEFIKNNQKEIAAIGEIGIDLHWEPEKKEEQKSIFSNILNKVIPYQKPIVLHTRSAHSIVYQIILETAPKSVIWHCYGGSLSLAKKIVENGMYISIPTSACRGKRYDKIIRDIPLENILTETDAPYQSIERDTRNESKYIPKSVEYIAKLSNKSINKICDTIFETFESIFLK